MFISRRSWRRQSESQTWFRVLFLIYIYFSTEKRLNMLSWFYYGIGLMLHLLCFFYKSFIITFVVIRSLTPTILLLFFHSLGCYADWALYRENERLWRCWRRRNWKWIFFSHLHSLEPSLIIHFTLCYSWI